MKLRIEELTYDIKNINYSINFNNEEERENLDIEMSKGIDTAIVGSEISDAYNGVIEILKNDEVLTFRNFILSNIGVYADQNSERISLRFIK